MDWTEFGYLYLRIIIVLAQGITESTITSVQISVTLDGYIPGSLEFCWMSERPLCMYYIDTIVCKENKSFKMIFVDFTACY